ncbi:peroxiredoxin [Alphaproteobacteria bacterium]|jgi:peroxiredoxin|nr:peroxiredoxin [Alphaproteobacteria bacterium]
MIKEGDCLPNLTLRSIADDGIQNFILHEKFRQKKILIICVPGAYTSTCHNQHLPPYIKGGDRLINEKKVDQICCITNNDPFVLDQWRISLGSTKITFLSDGNFEFLQKTQLIRNHEKSFMGNRLIRSVLLVNNLIISKLIFDDPGKLEKTSFESVLNTI